MKKITKLIILTGSLALLAVAYFLISGIVSDRETERTDGVGNSGDINTNYTAASIDINTLYSLKYRIDGNEYCFSLNSDSTAWIWEANQSLPLDSVYFANMASSLQSVTTNIKFKTTEAELATYGLDDPWLTVTASDSIHGTQVFNFGDVNSFNGQYYFQSESDSDSVYMVSPLIPTCFSFTPYEMVENDVLPDVDPENLKSVTLATSDNITVYKFYPNGMDKDDTTDDFWYVSENGADETPADEIAEYICGVCSLEFTDPVGYTPSERESFGIDGGVVMTVEYDEVRSVTDSSTGGTSSVKIAATYELLLGYATADGGIYAGLRDSSLSYKLDGDVLSKLYSPIIK